MGLATAAAWLFALTTGAAPVGDPPSAICTVVARIAVDRGERITFSRVDGERQAIVGAATDRFWGVRALARAWRGGLSPGPTLLVVDGVTVVRATRARRFAGYVAIDRAGNANLFFGSRLRGVGLDAWFFRRVQFGRGRARGDCHSL